MTNTNTNTEAGTLLLSYRPAPLLPCNRQDLAPLRLRYDPDNPSRRYACDTTPSLASYCYLPEPTSLVPICLRDDPSLASYCYPNLLPKSSVPDTWIILSCLNTSLALYCCRRSYPYLILVLSRPSLAPYCYRINR